MAWTRLMKVYDSMAFEGPLGGVILALVLFIIFVEVMTVAQVVD